MNLQKNVLLKDLTNYKIGGLASYFFDLKDIKDLDPELSKFQRIFILGKGTNVLIPDEGIDGLVIKNSLDSIELEGEKITVGSGVLFSDILNFCIENSLTGLEWAGGLPGTIGGAVRGNAGCFGGETKDDVSEVESIDFKTLKMKIRNNEECEFAYRWSNFKKNPNELITKVVLKVKKGNKDLISKSIQEKIDYRNLKHPMDYPNIGSTFKNIPVEKVSKEQQIEFAAFIKNDPFPVVLVTKLLALAELKGERIGDAQISEKHPNFIVNLGSAKASDVLKLVDLMKKTVKDKWGITLEEEIQILK